MIERVRHLNIPRAERYCLLCKSNQIEDEKHFLLHCKKFNTQRNIFNEKISNILVLWIRLVLYIQITNTLLAQIHQQ
jgi:hypothetical protein